MSARPRVVILGAGFAGLEAARRLARAPVELTLVDRENHHLFQPLLHELAAAVLQPADIAEAVRRVVPGRPGLRILMDEVTGIDRAARTVTLRHGTLPYDHLVVALGAGSSYFGNDHWRERTYPLKTLHDATRLRHRLLLAFERASMSDDAAERRRLLTFAVVGAGASGVQVAAALADFCRASLSREHRTIAPEDVSIVLIEALPRILAGVDEGLAAKAAQRLGRRGVRILTDAAVEDVSDDGVVAGGRRIEASTVIWTAGVEAAPIAGWLGVEAEKGGRVAVGEDLRLPEDERVLVVGDNAVVKGPEGEPLPGLAAVAKQQGRHAGDSLRRLIETGESPRPFRYRDRGSMVTLGRFAAITDLGRFKPAGRAPWLLWAVVHVAFLTNGRQRLHVLWNWLWAYVARRPGARVIVSHDEGVRPRASGAEATPTPGRERRSA
jgi:NADH:ubiquinone reductase (H+-translocating)